MFALILCFDKLCNASFESEEKMYNMRSSTSLINCKSLITVLIINKSRIEMHKWHKF